jgi:hypothetical protein
MILLCNQESISMKHILTKAAIENGQRRLILPILLVVSTMGCAVMEGVNVGANIPIGGIVNVGASKTIGESQAPAPTQKKPREKSDESSAESSDEAE